mgnify:FL=1|jgi:hypothetical protein|tara:strand:+ start:626 stop:1102 length:477 start_codon:yes stop_codon:yes gene_type:complete
MKLINKKFNVPTWELIDGHYSNYKQYLTAQNKTSKSRLAEVNKAITEERKRLKAIIADYEKSINDLIACRKQFKKEIEQVATEYSFRRKINALLKKHSYLTVFWDGDDDVYTTWVYSDDFGDNDDINDPYFDNHFCDEYEEAYERCLEYIECHEGETT